MPMLETEMSTQEKILALADTLIQQRGFQGFSYADLEKGIGIRKASIHHHFPSKTDLGLAYCEYKLTAFQQLESRLQHFAPGMLRLKGYLEAFSNCATLGEMCGVYAMLSDSYQFPPELQAAVNRLAQAELNMLQDILSSGQQSGEIALNGSSPDKLAMIICSALKGSLMLNRTSPHCAYAETVTALLAMFDGRENKWQ